MAPTTAELESKLKDLKIRWRLKDRRSHTETTIGYEHVSRTNTQRRTSATTGDARTPKKRETRKKRKEEFEKMIDDLQQASEIMKQCCQKTSFYRIAETFLIS
jgi:hypothetical protein